MENVLGFIHIVAAGSSPQTLNRMSCEEGEMGSRRHPASPAAAPPLDDDDLLAEILLRLPPQPSSLPRASAVCQRWRSLASDPAFSRCFRRHHRRSPPLLGCFIRHLYEIRFHPTVEPPNRLPEHRFPFPIDYWDRDYMMLGCRHGFVLMIRLNQDQWTIELLVWDPVNGHEQPLAIPPGFGVEAEITGAVLRPCLGDMNHFQVVLVSTDVEQGVIACVYSSETGVWGNLISTPLPSPGVIEPFKPAVLVGDCLYMLLLEKPSRIIEFNVDRQSLALIPVPVPLDSGFSRYCSVMRAEGGGLGIISTADGSTQLWKWKTDCDGVASWVLERTIELHNLLSLPNNEGIEIQGFAEENNVVFLWTCGGIFKVQLDSLQFKKLPEINYPYQHTFECVYAAGI